MKTSALLLSLLLPLTACSESGPSGSYSLETKMEEGPMPEMMGKMKVSMEIKDDGTFVIHSDNPDGSHSDVTGTWTMEGNEVTITGKDSESGEEHTTVLTMRGADLVMVEEQDGMKMEMIFVRQ